MAEVAPEGRLKARLPTIPPTSAAAMTSDSAATRPKFLLLMLDSRRPLEAPPAAASLRARRDKF
jgi:hypothetical protein